MLTIKGTPAICSHENGELIISRASVYLKQIYIASDSFCTDSKNLSSLSSEHQQRLFKFIAASATDLEYNAVTNKAPSSPTEPRPAIESRPLTRQLAAKQALVHDTPIATLNRSHFRVGQEARKCCISWKIKNMVLLS